MALLGCALCPGSTQPRPGCRGVQGARAHHQGDRQVLARPAPRAVGARGHCHAVPGLQAHLPAGLLQGAQAGPQGDAGPKGDQGDQGDQ